MKGKLVLALICVLTLSFGHICGCTAAETAENTPSADQEELENIDNSSVQDYDDENNNDETEVEFMYITIGESKLRVDLADNSSAAALAELLKEGDITYTADDYGGFEKVGDIGRTLPQNNERITTEPGDVILYLGTNICLYYGVNTWSFTRLGKINGFTEAQLREILNAGGGEVEITLSLS